MEEGWAACSADSRAAEVSQDLEPFDTTTMQIVSATSFVPYPWPRVSRCFTTFKVIPGPARLVGEAFASSALVRSIYSIVQGATGAFVGREVYGPPTGVLCVLIKPVESLLNADTDCVPEGRK